MSPEVTVSGVAVLMMCILVGTLPTHIASDASQYTISTVAGNGEGGSGGDGGKAIAAQLNHPSAVAVDRAGNLYIADNGNNRIRKVTPDGLTTTVAGTGKSGFSGDGGPATAAQLNRPYGVAVDGNGDLLIADTGNDRVRKVTRQGVITTLAGGGHPAASGDIGDGRSAREAVLRNPDDAQSDRAGNIYIADTGNHRVRQVAPNGRITTVAGTGKAGYTGDGGQAVSAELRYPAALVCGRKGVLYLCDFGNHSVRAVDTKGVIHTIAGSGMRGVTEDGKQAAGNPLNEPTGVAVTPDGRVIVADSANERLRRIRADGTLETIAGTGVRGFAGDNGPATAAQIAVPDIITTDTAGNIYFADFQNHRIRKLTPAPRAH